MFRIRFDSRSATSRRSTRAIRRGSLWALSLGTGLILSLAGTGTALGATGCRSDPVVVLSNLKVMDISAMIDDTQSDLKSVTYTMHLPRGVTPILVIPTDGLVGQVEHFAAYSDQPSGTYSVTTYVSTGATVSVTGMTIGVLSNSAVANGYSNENITVQL